MQILLIFGPKDAPEEGLFAVKFENEAADEFKKIMDFWKDPERMLTWCKANIKDIQNAFGEPITAEEAASELMDEAMDLRELLYELATKRNPNGSLQEIFKPLDNNNSNLTVLQMSKASAKTRFRKKPWLRIYALRIDKNLYIVTGGAIKLMHLMKDSEHTKEQLDRLATVRNKLKDLGVLFPEDLSDLL